MTPFCPSPSMKIVKGFNKKIKTIYFSGRTTLLQFAILNSTNINTQKEITKTIVIGMNRLAVGTNESAYLMTTDQSKAADKDV